VIGHDYWDHVLYDPKRCKAELRPVMEELFNAKPRDIDEDTTRYIVRGPKAVSNPKKVDPRIRRHRRSSLGIVMMTHEVVVWGRHG
jgi:hypothetical protein